MDSLTLDEVNALFQYWSENPPVHVLAAAWLLKGQKKKKSRPLGGLDELKRQVLFAGGALNKQLPEIYRHGNSIFSNSG